jgi:hypothetical protein
MFAYSDCSMRVRTSAHHTDRIPTVRLSESEMKMKTIAPPVAELAQLHDHAAGLVKVIETIPALKGNDLPQIVNRVHMLGKLAELEARFTDKGRTSPSDQTLRQRVRLLADTEKAEHQAGWALRNMSNKGLADRASLLSMVKAGEFNKFTDAEIDDAVAELQGERRRRRREAKTAQAEAVKRKPEEQETEEELEVDIDVDDRDVTDLLSAHSKGIPHVVR